MNFNSASKTLIKLGTVIAGASFISQFIYKIEPGESAIIFSKVGNGIQNKVYGPGYHFYIPIMQEIIRYDIKIQPYDHLTETGTKDLQKVLLKLRLFYKPVEERLP